jgi:hypothetical protein
MNQPQPTNLGEGIGQGMSNIAAGWLDDTPSRMCPREAFLQ